MAGLRGWFDALLARYGPQGWWPAASPFEMMAGAVLVQNASWANAEKAIRVLRTYGLLDPHKIRETDPDTLALAIRPAGTFHVKAERLKRLADWFVERFDGDAERMKAVPGDRLREELLAIRGIGPDTADSILVYAAGHPAFVADAYAHRLAVRHGMLGEEATVEDLKELFERGLPRDAELFGEFHALVVAVGKEYCRARKARCEGCPLQPFLPGK